MRHSHTLRISAKTVLAVVGLGLLGACADSTSAPIKQIAVKAPAGYDILVGKTTFTWSPSEGVTQQIGDHMIVIPAGAICDPTTSSYGVGEWDNPCDAATDPIEITAYSFTDVNGDPYVDFQPAVRFVPETEVDLYLKDGVRDGTHTLAMMYCATVINCVDESITDTTLATHRVGRSRILYRRLKHFSGYVINTGDECLGTIETLDDGTLWCDTDGRGDSRSGYVVATGLGKTSTGDTFGRRRRADK
jgi:hypothetical protein